MRKDLALVYQAKRLAYTLSFYGKDEACCVLRVAYCVLRTACCVM
jgi:hypothetical protein